MSRRFPSPRSAHDARFETVLGTAVRSYMAHFVAEKCDMAPETAENGIGFLLFQYLGAARPRSLIYYYGFLFGFQVSLIQKSLCWLKTYKTNSELTAQQ